LLEDGLLMGRGGSSIEMLAHSLEWQEKDFFGMRFRRISFPAIKGQARMRPGKFCETYPVGRFILRVSRHFIACVDGVLMGEYPIAPDRCIYAALEVVKAAEFCT
jgi:hypothetical protein